MLIDCTRKEQSGKSFVSVKEPKTIATYSLTLARFVFALCLSEREDSPTPFHFPLSQTDKDNILLFEKVMRDKRKGREDKLQVLHNLILALFLPFAEDDERVFQNDKFLHPLELFFPLLSLRDDGTFKDVKDITQPYAQFKYIIRVATLVEGNAIAAAKRVRASEYVFYLSFSFQALNSHIIGLSRQWQWRPCRTTSPPRSIAFVMLRALLPS